MPVRCIVPLVLFVFALYTSVPAQQAAQNKPLPDEIDQHFQYLSGTWDYSYQENGKTYHGVWSVRRSENGAALLSHFHEVGPMGKVSGNYLHGWNADSKQLVDNFVSDKIGIGQATYTLVSRDRADGQSESTLPDGTRRTTKLRSEYSPEKIVWTNYQTVLAGKPEPDRVFTFVRRKAESNRATPQSAATTIPEAVKTRMARQVGTWTTRGVRDEEPFEGLYQACWNNTETGLIFVSREGHQVLNGMSYWDDKAAEIIEVWATPSGSAVLHFNEFGNDRWRGYVDLRYGGDQSIDDVGIELAFKENQFDFRGDAAEGKPPFTVTNTKVTLEHSKKALQSFADLLVGGSWVNTEQAPAAKHTYSWLPGKKVLKLERDGGMFPGISTIAVHHPTQSDRLMEVDDDGTLGIATLDCPELDSQMTPVRRARTAECRPM